MKYKRYSIRCVTFESLECATVLRGAHLHTLQVIDSTSPIAAESLNRHYLRNDITDPRSARLGAKPKFSVKHKRK